MGKDDIRKEKQRIEEIYIEKEKKFTKLDEQTELFHNWINQTKESLFNIKSNWQSEEASIYFTKIEEEVSYLQSKNLQLAEKNDEDREKAKKEYLHSLENLEIKMKNIDKEQGGENAKI